LAAACIGCAAEEHEELGGPERAPMWFVDVAPEAGIDWRCTYGTNETDYILETTGPGPAWIDYDDDGNLDLFLLNGSHFDPDTLAARRPRAALYRNNGDGTFVDVTERAGVGFVGWGTAALAADFTSDGLTDLFVSAWGPNALYTNRGDGTFANETEQAGVGDALYGASACAIDYNRDGFLDIFVTNYVPFDTASADKPGTTRYTIVNGIPMSEAPEGYDGSPDRLYRNNGDGTFTDVAERAGMNGVLGRGLGAIMLDYDNDGMQNFMYRNNGDGTFTNAATRLGTAYGEGGLTGGSMGVAAGDLDGDGWSEIVVANYEDQAASVYQNHGGRYFTDVGVPWGIGGPSLMALQWGTVLADFDLDGAQDLYIAGSHVTNRFEALFPYSTFAQRNLLFANNGAGRFTEVGLRCGPGMASLAGSRGAAGGDFDNDGDVDIAVLNKNGRAELLRNDTKRTNHWIRFVLESAAGAPAGIGGRIRLKSNGAWQLRDLRAGSSYASTEDPRPLFGVGTATVVDSVVVLWPSGTLDKHSSIEVDRTIRLREGDGYAPDR